MNSNIHTAYAPGKVYFGGEYAVVGGQCSAIIFNTQVGVHTTFTVQDAWKITSSLLPQGFEITAYQSLVAVANNLVVQDAINIVQRYAQQKGITCVSGHLHIESGLDNSLTTKYGLGSSGAVCVGIIKVLAKVYNIELTPLELYKLAVLSQLEHFSYSSFGDLAVSAYDCWIMYHKYDTIWLSQHMHKDIDWLLHHVWPQLSIEPIKAHAFPMSLVFTNASADSQTMVKLMKKHTTKSYYTLFVETTRSVMDPLSKAIDQDCTANVLRYTKSLASALDMLQRNTMIPIRTATMDDIETMIEPFDGFIKVSGAGGGDCVWCLYPDSISQQRGNEVLMKAGFIILDHLVFAPTQVTV